jgi:hypothetical protein
MDSDIYIFIKAIASSPLAGAAAAIAATYFTNYQLNKYKKQSYRLKKLKEAYLITAQFLNDTEILLETKTPLIKLLPRSLTDDSGQLEDLYTGLGQCIDRKKRKWEEFFDESDLKKSAELKFSCDLYASKAAFLIADKIDKLVKKQNLAFMMAAEQDQPGEYENVIKNLMALKKSLLKLKQLLKPFLLS